MTDDLIEFGASVRTRTEFASFLTKLHSSLLNEPQVWENITLIDFLEAAAAWTDDSPGYYRNMGLNIDPEQPTWRVFADILLAASVYE